MKKSETILDLEIDENELDQEWTSQPSLYFRYAAKAADARRELDQAKSMLDVVKAETDRDVRSDPVAFGLVKTTEKQVEATVALQPKVLESQQEVIEARYNLDIFQAAATALDHRKKALESLVSLHLANYFSKPKAPEGAKDKMADVEKKMVRRKGKRRQAEG